MASNQLFENNADTTLASTANSGDTTITVASGKGALFPSPTGDQYFLVTIADAEPETQWEVCRCTSRSSDVLTVTRAQEGTTAQTWAAGSTVSLRITKQTILDHFKDFNDILTANGEVLVDNNGNVLTK